MTNEINGIDVSESVSSATNNNICYSQKAVDELQNNIKRLQEENEGLKSLNDFNVQKIEVLQEENKKLKNKNNDLIEEIASGNIDITILQKENEKLKAKVKNYKLYGSSTVVQPCNHTNTEYDLLVLENEELKKENEQLKKPCLVMPKVKQLAVPIEKYEKLYKALEEINILAKNYCNTCDEFKAKTYKNKNDCLYCNYGFIKRKINEVLNDRN